MNLLSRFVVAVVVAVLVTLVTTLVGSVLVTLEVAIAVTVGRWFEKYAAVLGVLAFLYYAFAGGSWTPWNRGPRGPQD